MSTLKATFELHNTVLINSDEVGKFEEFCATNKLKPIHVMILYNRNYQLNEYPITLIVLNSVDTIVAVLPSPTVYATSKRGVMQPLHLVLDWWNWY